MSSGHKRRRGHQQPEIFAGVDRQPANRRILTSQDTPDLEVRGLPCTIFEDPDAAASFDAGNHLLPCFGDESLRVDRFDVRLLLHSASDAARSAASGFSADEEAALDVERYRDLGEEAASESEDESSAYGRRATPGSMQAVPFAYETPTAQPRYQELPHTYEDQPETVQMQQDADIDADGEPFVPPFDVPEALQSRLPRTVKQQEIIQQTAAFVRGAGGQSEFRLGMQQAGNPNFAFLRPDHRLHPYYRWLLQNNPEAWQEGKSSAEQPAAAATGPSGLDMLLASYDTDAASEPSTPRQLSQEASQEDANEAHPAVASADSAAGSLPAEPLAAGPAAAHGSSQQAEAEAAGAGVAQLTQPAAANGSNDAQAAGDSRAAAAAAPPQLPADVRAIIDKLVAFVKAKGVAVGLALAKREAANPRFGFLQPSHEYHAAYRAAVLIALDSAAADQLLPPLPLATQEEAASAASPAAHADEDASAATASPAATAGGAQPWEQGSNAAAAVAMAAASVDAATPGGSSSADGNAGKPSDTAAGVPRTPAAAQPGNSTPAAQVVTSSQPQDTGKEGAEAEQQLAGKQTSASSADAARAAATIRAAPVRAAPASASAAADARTPASSEGQTATTASAPAATSKPAAAAKPAAIAKPAAMVKPAVAIRANPQLAQRIIGPQKPPKELPTWLAKWGFDDAQQQGAALAAEVTAAEAAMAASPPTGTPDEDAPSGKRGAADDAQKQLPGEKRAKARRAGSPTSPDAGSPTEPVGSSAEAHAASAAGRATEEEARARKAKRLKAVREALAAKQKKEAEAAAAKAAAEAAAEAERKRRLAEEAARRRRLFLGEEAEDHSRPSGPLFKPRPTPQELWDRLQPTASSRQNPGGGGDRASSGLSSERLGMSVGHIMAQLRAAEAASAEGQQKSSAVGDRNHSVDGDGKHRRSQKRLGSSSSNSSGDESDDGSHESGEVPDGSGSSGERRSRKRHRHNSRGNGSSKRHRSRQRNDGQF